MEIEFEIFKLKRGGSSGEDARRVERGSKEGVEGELHDCFALGYSGNVVED
jgi:hypothetical protein